MAAIAGTSILNTGGTAADNPVVNPILTAPSNGATILGFAFTNPSNTPITVTLYRDVIAAAGIINVGGTLVPPLAGMPGGPAVVIFNITVSLAPGETIFAFGTIGGLVNVEIDGLSQGSTTLSLSTNQLLAGLMLQLQQLGADIPDASMLGSSFNF